MATFRDACARWMVAMVAVGATAPALAADDLESLAARVAVLEAREEIRALIMAYGQAHDNRDYRTFSTLFASNGEWVGGLGSAKGPQAIFELMDRTIGHNPQPNGSGTYHVMTNDQIKIDGDRASATTKWLYVTPGEPAIPAIDAKRRVIHAVSSSGPGCRPAPRGAGTSTRRSRE